MRDWIKTIAFISILTIALLATPTVVSYALSINEGTETIVIERVSEDTKQDAIAKHRRMEALKATAKQDWENQRNEEVKAKAKAETEKIQRDKMLMEAAEAKKEELHQQALEQSKAKIKAAEEAARKSAKKAALLKKKLKEKKKHKALLKEKKEDLGSYVDYSIGSAGRSYWKSFEYGVSSSGRNIFGRTSDQYKLQNRAYVGKYGIFMVDGRYSAAIGSHYGKKVGTKFDVYLSNGNVIKCIMGDQKANKDTDSTNSYHVDDGSYLEFIVHPGSFNRKAKKAGTAGVIPEFSGNIEKIRVYK